MGSSHILPAAPVAAGPSYRFSSKVLTRDTLPIPAAAFPHLPLSLRHAVGTAGAAEASNSPRLRALSARRSVLPIVQADLKQQYDPTGRLTALFDRRSHQCIPPGSIVSVETWTSTPTPQSASATTTGGGQGSFSSFSGILLGVKRRGTATSLLVRTLAGKLGVEMRFALYSPRLKDVKVVQRADASKRGGSIKAQGKVAALKAAQAAAESVGDAEEAAALAQSVEDQQSTSTDSAPPAAPAAAAPRPTMGGLRRARRAKLYYLRRDDKRLAGVTAIVKRMKAAEAAMAVAAAASANASAAAKGDAAASAAAQGSKGGAKKPAQAGGKSKKNWKR